MDDPTPRIGSVCKDGGTCHHQCSATSGCFRQDGCVPLSCSGLDDLWRTPAEAARDEAALLAAATPASPSKARATL